MKKAPPLKVALYGMDARARELFAMFVAGPGQHCCEIVENGAPEAVVIDLDGVGSDRLWLEVRRHFSGPAVVLSVRSHELHHAIWVPKPLRGEGFIAAIARVRGMLQHVTVKQQAQPSTPPRREDPPPTPSVQREDPGGAARAADLAMQENRAQECCGHLEDSVYRDQSQRERLFYRPSEYLQGALNEAVAQAAREGRVAMIDGLGYPLYIHPDRGELLTTMREQYLRPLCVRRMDDQPIEIRTLEQLPALTVEDMDPRLRRQDATLWKIALWTSRGRVPEGVALDAPVRLRAWPNIPRLMAVPHGVRIAALWMHRPTSLMETAPLLGIDYRYPFAFFSACHALGLIQTEAGRSPDPRAAKAGHDAPPPEERRGLFRRMLDKLGLHT
ncbi:MAG: hypothetical protein ACOZAQ_03555 [Pseudomonadota bacterium]